jgi:hypothetical protein
VADIHRLPTRENFVDDRGVGLRATRHADDGIVVLSIWHDEQCTASFRLPVSEAARLAGMLVTGVSDWASSLEVALPSDHQVG